MALVPEVDGVIAWESSKVGDELVFRVEVGEAIECGQATESRRAEMAEVVSEVWFWLGDIGRASKEKVGWLFRNTREGGEIKVRLSGRKVRRVD